MCDTTDGMVNWGAGVIVASAIVLTAAAYASAVNPEPVMLDVQGVPVIVDDHRPDVPEGGAPTFETYEFPDG